VDFRLINTVFSAPAHNIFTATFGNCCRG